MKIRKFFEYLKQNISNDDVMDIFLDISDDYNCDIEVRIEETSPFFCSKIQHWDKAPKIGRFEAISKIIEFKTGELITFKFILNTKENTEVFSLGDEFVKLQI